MRLEEHALAAGIGLQVLACLMNVDTRLSLLQTGIGLGGVVLMVIGFHHLTTP